MHKLSKGRTWSNWALGKGQGQVINDISEFTKMSFKNKYLPLIMYIDSKTDKNRTVL